MQRAVEEDELPPLDADRDDGRDPKSNRGGEHRPERGQRPMPSGVGRCQEWWSRGAFARRRLRHLIVITGMVPGSAVRSFAASDLISPEVASCLNTALIAPVFTEPFGMIAPYWSGPPG